MKAITVKFFGPSSTRCARYVASDLDGNRAMIPSNRSPERNGTQAALALCKRMKWTGTLVHGGLNKRGDEVYVFDTPHCRVQIPEEPVTPGRALSSGAIWWPESIIDNYSID